MELPQTLAVESFSCSWLSSVGSPLDGLEEPLGASSDSAHEATSLELECKFLESKRSLEEAHNFNFDVPIRKHPETIAQADQLFSGGLIKPIFINQSKVEVPEKGDSVPTFQLSSKTVVPAVDIQYHIFKRWRKSSERILKKCVGYLRQLRHKMIGTEKSKRVDDIGRRQVKKWRNLPQTPPNMACSTNSWSDIESSIYEAVLHCKRSIGK